MHTGLIIIAAIFLLIVFITELFFHLKKRKKTEEQNLHNQFFNLVQKHGLAIHYKDVFHNRAIGLDRKNNLLLLLDLNASSRLQQCLHLDAIISCSIVQLNGKDSNSNKVLLEILHTDSPDPIFFCFYDEALDNKTDKTCFLLKAKDWSQRLNFHKKYWWLRAKEYA
jgi:hypothetical protein